MVTFFFLDIIFKFSLAVILLPETADHFPVYCIMKETQDGGMFGNSIFGITVCTLIKD